MRWTTLCAVSVTLPPATALACDTMPFPTRNAHLPAEGAVVGPSPLIASFVEPYLSDASNETLPLEPAELPADLGDLIAIEGSDSLRAWRPVTPLEPGEYRLTDDAGDTVFTVIEEPGPDVPAPPPQAELALTIMRPSPPTCIEPGRFYGTSCDDVDRAALDVRFPIPSGDTTWQGPYVLTVEGATLPTRSYLVSAVRTGIDGSAAYIELSEPTGSGRLAGEGTCVSLAAVGSDGGTSAPVALGCIDPTDAGDARVSHFGGRDAGDCNVACNAAGVPPELLALLLAVGLRRAARGTVSRR